MKVRFLIAGVQKGGTTALYDHLRAHPDLELPREKEPHFFDDDAGIDWSAPDYGRYEALFSDDGRMKGEATPIYTYWPNCLERARAYNPAMKLVVLFRDPVARAFSHWRMETGRGAEDRPFGWCVRQGRARVDDPAAPGHHRVHSYVERGFYAPQVERLLALFPREQVLFLRSADLRRSPRIVLDRLCDFLGAPRMGEVPPLESHVGPIIAGAERIDPADAAYLRDLYAADQAAWSRLTGLDPETPVN